MKFKFYFFLFAVILSIGFTSYGQAPAQPVNPVPADQDVAGTNNPDLCAEVNDPDGGTLQVKYSGRANQATAQKSLLLFFYPIRSIIRKNRREIMTGPI